MIKTLHGVEHWHGIRSMAWSLGIGVLEGAREGRLYECMNLRDDS